MKIWVAVLAWAPLANVGGLVELAAHIGQRRAEPARPTPWTTPAK